MRSPRWIFGRTLLLVWVALAGATRAAEQGPLTLRGGNYRYAEVVLRGLTSPLAAAHINLALRTRPEEAPSESRSTRVVAAGAVMLSIVMERWVQEGGAHATGYTRVRHFNVRTGEERRLADFFKPGAMARLESVLRDSEEFAFDPGLLSRLRGTDVTTEGYFAEGKLHVCVKPVRNSFAGDSEAFCRLPIATALPWLAEQGRSMAAQPPFNTPRIQPTAKP